MKVTMSALLVATALAVGVVGGSAEAARQAAPARSPQASKPINTVNVAASEFKFVLSSKTAKRGVVIFKVQNVGKLAHDFQINGRRTPLIQPGKTNTLRVVFLRKGAYPYKCTVPGHAAGGMTGIFTIT